MRPHSDTNKPRNYWLDCHPFATILFKIRPILPIKDWSKRHFLAKFVRISGVRSVMTATASAHGGEFNFVQGYAIGRPQALTDVLDAMGPPIILEDASTTLKLSR
jgi:hypothetical protein